MSNIAFLFLPLAFSSLPAVLPFVSPSSQVGYELFFSFGQVPMFELLQTLGRSTQSTHSSPVLRFLPALGDSEAGDLGTGNVRPFD